MGKKVVTWRVPDGVLARLDEIAEGKGCTRSAVLDAAVSNYLDDAGRGPVELSPPREVDSRPRAVKPPAEHDPAPFPGQQGYETVMRSRQQRLNRQLYGK